MPTSRRRKTKKKKKKPRKPTSSPVLQGRGFTMRQVGRHIIMNTHRSPEEHKRLMADLRESRVSLPETLRQEVKELEALLLKYNSFDLLANMMFLEVFTDPETYKEYSYEGMQVVVEYAALLYLKHPFNIGTEIVIAGTDLQEIRDRIRRILWTTAFYYAAESADENREGPPPKIDELRFRTILNELFVRSPGYPHHMSEVLTALFTPFDPWLRENLGFSLSDALAIDEGVSRLISKKFFDRRDEAVRTERQMAAELREHRASKKVKNEEHREMLERFSKMSLKKAQKAIRSGMIAWVSSFLGTILSLSSQEIASETKVPAERVQACLRYFSIEFGSVDTDFYMLTRTRELKMHPFLHHNGSYLCPNPGLFLWTIQPMFENALNPDIEGAVCQDKKLWERYKEVRADYLERESLKLFGDVLKHAEVYHKLNYSVLEEGKAQLTELDGLILCDGNLFLLEAKAGGFFPSGRRGAKDRMVKHLKEIIGGAHSQAVRAKTYIDTTETPKFVLKNGKEVVIDKTKVRRTFLVTVSLEPLSVFTSTLSDTAELDILERAELPWAVSLLDLKVICEMIEFPAHLVHYLYRRLRLNEIKRISAHDELDWLGHYISEGLYFESFEQNGFDFFRLQTYTTKFDDYYLYKTGERETPAPKPVQPMPERFREIIRELETVHDPGYSEVACRLLDLDSATREQFVKLFDRIRALNQSDGLKHDFTLILEREKFGISCMAASAQQREEAFRRLSGYSTLKKYQAHAKEWLGILTLGDRPELVHQWVLYRFPWTHDEKLEAAVASLPGSTEGREGSRS